MQLQNFAKEMEKFVNDKGKEIQQIAESTAEAVLRRNKSYYTRKLRSLIMQLYYNHFAESEYYDRTYQFAKNATCNIVRTATGWGIEISFNAGSVVMFAPEKKGNYYSYGYSWGERKGEPIGQSLIEDIYANLDEQAQISKTFLEWFEEDFEIKFDTLLSQRIAKLNK